MDAKTTTREVGAAEMKLAWTQLEAEVADQAQRQASAAEARRQRQESAAETAARIQIGIAAAAQSLAAAHQARLQQMQTQHTTCQVIVSQLDCTTRGW